MSNSNNNDYYVRRDNNLIANKLNNVYHKLVSINNSFINEENEEFENLFNRVNFYFSNIILQLKLKYIENIKKLEEINSQNENDILNLIMENMILKIEKQNLQEKNLNKINSSKIIEDQFQKEEIKIINKKENIKKQIKKSRNKHLSKYFDDNKDESFKNDVKTFLNSKFKKKMNINKTISSSFNLLNINQNYINSSINNLKKKNNLSNFIMNSNLIKENSKNKNINKSKKKYQSISTLSTFFNHNKFHNNFTNDNKFSREKDLNTIPTRLKNSFNDLDNFSNCKLHLNKDSISKKSKEKSFESKKVFNILSRNIHGNKSTQILSNKNNISQIKKSDYRIYQKMLIKKLNTIHHSNMKELINLKIKKNKI